jgi:hypothetical protein
MIRAVARAAAALLLLVALALPAAAPAATPGRRYRTLETPHFVLSFHEGLYPVALRAARSLELAHRRLVPLLGAEPDRRTEVTLSDDTDDANGSATATILPRIDLLAEPPDDLSVLGDYDDYVYLLVAHEYVHVLHLGAASGLPRALSWLLGDLFLPNGVQPRFVTEGLAVYQETGLSSAGRLRSAMFDMYLRADVLEDRLLTLSQLTGEPHRWPGGTAAYLYGGFFLEYLATTRGDEAIAAYVRSYGRSVIPYDLNLSLHEAAGVDWIELYDEWTGAIRDAYGRQAAAIRARGPLTVPAVATRWGERTGAPRWAPSGREVDFVEASPDRRPRLRALDVITGEDREIHDLGASGELAPLRDGRVLVAHPERFRTRRLHGELFAVDADGERQLTRGLRASEPDVAPDGKTVYFVRRGDGRTVLASVSLDRPDAPPRILYEPPPGRQLFTPRVSPDGTTVAISEHRAGPGRDLVLVDRATGKARRLTDDAALDLDPCFTPDGGTIVYASDRDGVFNLYAIPVGGGEARRLTNVLTGAFQPAVSPDGTWLAWTTYSARGFDVAAAPLASLGPPAAAVAPRPRPEPTVVADGPLYPVRPYAPLRTLAPRYWMPFLGADPSGTVVGAFTSGGDIVGLHVWGASAGVGVGSREPQGSLAYGYRGFYPDLDAAVSTGVRSVAGFPDGTTERFASGGASMTFPFATLRRAQSLRLGYEAVSLDPLEKPDPADAPRPGVATEFQLGWAYGSTEHPVEAISPENGLAFSAAGRVGTPALGGDFEYVAASAGAGAYVRLPWARHHVLALSATGAVSRGDLGERRVLSLGGPTLRDPVLDLLYTGVLLGDFALRGYRPGAFSGNRLVLGTAEYRLPLAFLDRAPYTLPIGLGRWSGAAFVEAGGAADRLGWGDVHPSAGLETRLDVAVGYAATFALRAGWAYGFDVAAGGGNRFFVGVGLPL